MTSKMNDCVQVNLRITTNSNQGGRKYMEDTYSMALQRLTPADKDSPISLAYFGIFDGHGGKEAAEYARQTLCQRILEQDEFWPNTSDESQYDQSVLSAIRRGFLACHNDMWNHVEKWTKTSSGLQSTSGCTASIAFIRGHKIYIGHVGDSAIVLGEGETLYKLWRGTRLTKDHKPEDPTELQRIRDSGGNVLCKAGVHRVVWNRQKSATSSSNSCRHRHQHSTTTTTTSTGTVIEYEQIPFLAVSRALGDLWSLNAHTNLYSVSPEPELSVIEIDPNKHRCLILASDGLWNMISPESAVEIVRNCDVKTEEMILRTEDDDHRPFRNPSHELVQKALAVWRERMLRSDNITCVTVMLDPPGPPFSDCIIKKKKERLTYSVSSSTNSVCSDDTIELDHPPPVIATSATITTSLRPKPPLERKEHILTPISNGPTPLRTPKRRVSEDVSTLMVDTPRRKLMKTNQQKENGRTSVPSQNCSESESSSRATSLSSPLQSPSPSNLTEEMEQDFIFDTEQATPPRSADDDHSDSERLNQKVHQFLRDHNEQSPEETSMKADREPEDASGESSTKLFQDRCSNVDFLSKRSNSSNEEHIERMSRCCRRRRSMSITISTNEETKPHFNVSHRRKSCSSAIRSPCSNNRQMNESSRCRNDATYSLEKNSSKPKITFSLSNFTVSNSEQSSESDALLSSLSPHRSPPLSQTVDNSILSSSS